MYAGGSSIVSVSESEWPIGAVPASSCWMMLTGRMEEGGAVLLRLLAPAQVDVGPPLKLVRGVLGRELLDKLE